MQKATYICFIYACRNGCMLHSAITVHFHSGLWYICGLGHLRVGGKIALQNLYFAIWVFPTPFSTMPRIPVFKALLPQTIFPSSNSQFLEDKQFAASHMKINAKFLLALVKTHTLLFFEWILCQFFRTSTFLRCHFKIHKSHLYKKLTISSIVKENLLTLTFT